MNHSSLLFIFLSFILITSCNKDETGPQRDDPNGGNGIYADGLFVINEGNFGSNNASLSYLDVKNEMLSNDIFSAANDGKRIGDVLQSMIVDGERTYLVVNNSKKIEVLQSSTMRYISTITGLNSPRYMQIVNPNKAYVSNFTLGTNGSVQIVDPLNGMVLGNIEVSGWSEQMKLIGSQLWICNMTRGSIQVVDINTDEITGELNLTAEPNSLVKDANDNLWVLCSGGFEEEIPALYHINTISQEVKKYQLNFNIKDSPSNLCINQNKDSLFFLDSHVFKVAVDNPQGNKVKAVDLNNFQYPYGLYVYGPNNEVYVSEAYDFQRDGKLFKYSSSGKLIRQFTVGEGPSFMYEVGN